MICLDTQFLLDIFEQYGYIALFIVFWLTVVWTPIPNEAVVMSGGYISTLGVLNPVLTFLVTYLGIIMAYTTSYIAGRLIGSPALEYLTKKRNWGKQISKAQSIVNRYGSISLVISYIAPIVQIVFPFIVGINKMTFSRFALFTYIAGLLWTLIYFFIGRYFGNYMDISNQELINYSWVIGILAVIIIVLRKRKKQKLNKEALPTEESKEIV